MCWCGCVCTMAVCGLCGVGDGGSASGGNNCVFGCVGGGCCGCDAGFNGGVGCDGGDGDGFNGGGCG